MTRAGASAVRRPESWAACPAVLLLLVAGIALAAISVASARTAGWEHPAS